MKLTVLDMTQNILSSMDSDEVNSISDTTESRQVAEIIRTCYFNILSRLNLPEHSKLFSLVPSGDVDLPVLMYRPDFVARVDWIKYNIADEEIVEEPRYEYVTILPNQQFLDMVHQFNPDETNVGKLTFDDHVFFFKTDKRPEFCTVLSDLNILFDSYNSSLETTLQETKTLCYGRVTPTFSMTDGFIPDLDAAQFPLLLSEAKSTAFIEMKQVENAKAEREARRQWNVSQKHKYTHKFKDFSELPNFGRRKR